MDNLDFSNNSTNVDNTNEVHISFKEENNLEISSINDASELSGTLNDTPNCEEGDNSVSSNVALKEESSTSTEESTEVTALVEVKPHGLLVAQTMFKKSIKISIKSFLISLSLGFLNLFF